MPSALHMAAADEAAATAEHKSIVLDDSAEEEEEDGYADDVDDGQLDQQQKYSPRPRRRTCAPKRYTPTKEAKGRRRGRYAYTVKHMHPLSHKAPNKKKKQKTSTAPRRLAVQLEPEEDPADDVVADTDLTSVALGLQLSGQYSQLLLELQDLLSTLHPVGQLCTQPNDLLEELAGLAAHRQQLQELQDSLTDLMHMIQQLLPGDLQQQALQTLAAFSCAEQQDHRAGLSPGASSANLQHDPSAAAAAAGPGPGPAAAMGRSAGAAAGVGDAADLLLSQGYGSPVVACPVCFSADGLCAEELRATGQAGTTELQVCCTLCGWLQPLGCL